MPRLLQSRCSFSDTNVRFVSSRSPQYQTHFLFIVVALLFCHHQGLSKGSDAPPNAPNPPVFGFGFAGCCATGLAAEVHPPKSSSAVTDACLTGLFADAIGAPQPPEMSFGVIFSGGLPKFTGGAAGFAGAGSGAPQGLLSPPDDQGSNNELLFGDITAGRLTGVAAEVGLGAGCAERLNAELKSLPRIAAGGEAIGAGAGAGAGADGVDAQPPKSSELKRSAGMFVAGFGTGAAAAFGAGAGAGGEAGNDC